MYKTEGKVALVTGALGGIGKWCVKALLQNGVRGVLLVDCNDAEAQSFLEELMGEFGDGKAYFAKVDVAKEDELKGAFDEAVRRFSQLDIVINNAGVGRQHHNLVVDVNLRAVVSSTYLAMTEYLPKYRDGGEAVILNVSSVSGLVPLCVSPAYTATKVGLVFFGRSLKPLQNDHVKVLTLCPSFTDTPMLNFAKEMPREEFDVLTDGLYRKLHSAKSVGKAIVEVVKVGSHSSVWLVNNDELPVEVEYGEVDKSLKEQILKSS